MSRTPVAEPAAMVELALGRVLIVDDEVELMTALTEMLNELGFNAAGYVSASQALEALREQDFDLLLSDLMMPEMDGITLLRSALAIDHDLVAILMTGQGTVQTAVDAMKVGAFDFILKPFKLQTLMPIITRALQVRRLRRENLRLRDSLAIYELGHAVSAALDLPTILDKFADAALVQCQADQVSILLPTPDQEELYVAAVRGEGREYLLGQRVQIGQSPAGWVAQHREALILSGAVDDPRIEIDQPRPEIQSSVVYPLVYAGKLVGILCANATNHPRPPTLGELKALELLASIAGAALENARLLADARRAEAETRESERRLRQFMAGLPIGVLITDAEGNAIYANPVAEELLGRSTAMADGTGYLADLYPVYRTGTAEEYPVEARPIMQALRGETSMVDDMEIRLPDRNVPIEVWGCPVRDEEGHVRYAIAAFVDVTDRRAAEEQLRESEDRLRQAQKMEAVGLLAGGIAHDFNNLLTAIIGFGDLVATRLPDESPVMPLVTEIVSAGERASSLTRQLLAFSRKQVLAPEILDLNEIVVDMGKLLRRIIGENIDLVTVLAPDLRPTRLDRGQTEQVIMNLAVNARDAMPNGGKLTITTANWDESGEGSEPREGDGSMLPPGGYVRLTVSDDGTGMDEETRGRIFEPFFTTKEQGKGTGLGLSTVYGIVKQSGGDVRVSSALGSGTSFEISLPAVEADRGAAASASAGGSMGGRETVLLVEDEHGVRALTKLVLEQNGYDVIEASSAEEALAVSRARQSEPQLLITDLMLPGLNGRELAERLTELKPGLKILFVSGYTDDVAARLGILESRVAFLQKPFTPSSLARKVRDVLDE